MFCRTYFRTFAKCDVCLTEFHLKLDARVSGIQSVGLNAKKIRVFGGAERGTRFKPFLPFETTEGDHVTINFFLPVVVLGVN